MESLDLVVKSEFLKAERLPVAEVLRQAEMFAREEIVTRLFERSEGVMVVLNAQRQIIWANLAFRRAAGVLDEHGVIGARFGEAAGCVWSARSPGGCGTTRQCRDCGAARATCRALAERPDERLAELKTAGGTLALALRTTPFRFGGERFVLMTSRDFPDQEKERVLDAFLYQDMLGPSGNAPSQLLS